MYTETTEMNKIYTAFISSAFESLRDERNRTIDCLLDFRVLPIGMEHFTVSTNGEFSDIEELIDEADFFILLMGRYYGSCDSDGVSWTEREYEYARLKNKPIIAILCDELIPNLEADSATLREEETKQVEFSKKIGFARRVSPEFGIKTIVSQFLSTYNYSKCVGWSRIEDFSLTQDRLVRWQKENEVYNIGGLWYHVHLSEEDNTYVRIGTVTVQQEFSPNSYRLLRMDGVNYSVEYYDTEKGLFKENKMKSSKFTGEYTLGDNGEILGIFNSRRSFNGAFNFLEVNKGARRGIHDFSIDVYADTTKRIDGEFHDEAPSPKMGRIFMFRAMEDRDKFLLENRESVIEKR